MDIFHKCPIPFAPRPGIGFVLWVYAVLVMFAVFLVGISASRVIYPYDVGHFEACVWTPSLLGAQGKNPYAYATQAPFVMAPYGYLYYLTVGAGLRLFGLQLWFGRVLTVVSAMVCVVCIVRLSRELACRKESAVLAVMTFLTSLPLYHYIAVHRPDLPALALAFGAITLAFPAREKTLRGTVLTIVLLVAAFYFKQTALLPIAVVVARYLQTGRFKQVVFVLFGVTAVAAATAVALNVTSAGGYFWQHFVLTRHIPYSYSVSLKWLGSICRSPSNWIAVGLIAAGGIKQARRLSVGNPLASALGTTSGKLLARVLKSPQLLFLGYLVAAATMAFVTSARSGSYVNYYLEASIVLAVVVAIGWDWLAAVNQRRRLFLAIVGLFVFAAGVEFWRMARAESYRWKSLGYYREVVETLKREVPPGQLVISVHPELAVASGHNYHFGDFLQYLDGRSPELQKLIADEFQSKRYGAIVWLTRDDPKLAGYKLAPMESFVHEKYYPVYVFLPE